MLSRRSSSAESRNRQPHVRVRENDIVKPLAVHHVAINVPDLEEALVFYEGSLGFVRRDDRPDFGFPGAWLDVGDQQLHLVEAEAPPNVGQHFAVRVDDLDAVIAELRAGGHRPSDPSPVGTGRQAFITDPSGNVVELHEIG
jgi:glyoxylase I family protein